MERYRKSLPAQPGWYWHYCPSDGRSREKIVLVRSGDIDRWWIEETYAIYLHACKDCLWAGPLKAPPRP